MRRRPALFPALPSLALAALAAAGCASDPAAGPGPDPVGPGDGPTYHADVEPLLQKHCMGCHAPGRLAPFGLTTYEEASTVAGLMAKVAADRTMPPWGAFETEECTPRHGWKQDLRLTDAEIATLEAWSAAGAPKGDPADAPPPYTPGADGLPGVELELAPDAPYVASGDADQFRCFVMNPGLTQTRYLNGSHFIAGNPKVVHHALLFLDRNGDSEALADADGGYDCFGGVGFGAQLVAAWAPGGVPFELDPNIGTAIPAGSRLVMQIHYHPAGTTAEPDATRFQMRFTESVPEYLMTIALLGNFDELRSNGDGLLPGPNDAGGVQFRIPAGAKDHVESMRFTLPHELDGQPMPELFLYGTASHMHYVGTDMKIDLEHLSGAPTEPAEECLLQTPQWNFAWQRAYSYDAPIDALPRFLPDDVLKMRCTYDNSMDNPYVQKALADQHLTSPVDVFLGEETLDEMCLSALAIVLRNE